MFPAGGVLVVAVPGGTLVDAAPLAASPRGGRPEGAGTLGIASPVPAGTAEGVGAAVVDVTVVVTAVDDVAVTAAATPDLVWTMLAPANPELWVA